MMRLGIPFSQSKIVARYALTEMLLADISTTQLRLNGVIAIKCGFELCLFATAVKVANPKLLTILARPECEASHGIHGYSERSVFRRSSMMHFHAERYVSSRVAILDRT